MLDDVIVLTFRVGDIGLRQLRGARHRLHNLTTFKHFLASSAVDSGLG